MKPHHSANAMRRHRASVIRGKMWLLRLYREDNDKRKKEWRQEGKKEGKKNKKNNERYLKKIEVDEE